MGHNFLRTGRFAPVRTPSFEKGRPVKPRDLFKMFFIASVLSVVAVPLPSRAEIMRIEVEVLGMT